MPMLKLRIIYHNFSIDDGANSVNEESVRFHLAPN